ncbi:MAG: primosomal protein N' [Pseudomonadota bacterium]
MSKTSHSVWSVAVFAPLRQSFDYRWEGPPPPDLVGQRVAVPFGRSQRLGIVVKALSQSSTERLKAIDATLDDGPLFDEHLLQLGRWAADYYQYPLGEVLQGMLPTLYRRRRPVPSFIEPRWCLTAAGRAVAADALKNAPRQAEILAVLAKGAATYTSFLGRGYSPAAAFSRLESKGWIESHLPEDAVPAPIEFQQGFDLNDAQRNALARVAEAEAKFSPVLLDGVTGSGKTEVYLQAARRAAIQGKQTIVLVPEIGLTDQMVRRFASHFGDALSVFHSGLSERERTRSWQRCRRGEIAVLLGTRSSIWVAAGALGLIIVDEEHDPSYKQQEGFRYSARDVAVMRAKLCDCPIILGSATPSLESLANVDDGKYELMALPDRIGSAALPSVEYVDIRGVNTRGGIGNALAAALADNLDSGKQSILFLNRRGYAPLSMCFSCGTVAQCDKCDAYLVVHKRIARLVCHHCERSIPLNGRPDCCADPDCRELGVGTERVEEALQALFPRARLLRIDRDTVTTAKQIETAFSAIREGAVDIILGTQMIAKGHDFPDVTLVGVIDADSRLFSLDFRAPERLAQLIVQVAGRAGRGQYPGKMIVQTLHPHHPLFEQLKRLDFAGFARNELAVRRKTSLPPFAAMLLIRAESQDRERPSRFLNAVRTKAFANVSGIASSAPLPAAIERKSGVYRNLIVMRSPSRHTLHRHMRESIDFIEGLAKQYRVRWFLDVDPVDVL